MASGHRGSPLPHRGPYRSLQSTWVHIPRGGQTVVEVREGGLTSAKIQIGVDLNKN